MDKQVLYGVVFVTTPEKWAILEKTISEVARIVFVKKSVPASKRLRIVEEVKPQNSDESGENEHDRKFDYTPSK